MTLEDLLYPADLYQGKPRIQKLEGGALAFVLSGADIEFKTKPGGDLDGFMVRVSGQYDVAVGALVLLPRAPWSIFSRVKFKPQGRAQFIDSVNAYSLAVHDWHTKGLSPFTYGARDIRPAGLQANTTGRNALIESFPLGIANDQTFELWFYISARRSALDPRGRIPLTNDHQLRLVLTPNSEAGLVTVPGNWAQDSLQAEVWQVTYDDVPPAPGVIKQPDHQWAVVIEEGEKVAQIGRNEISIEPDGSLVLGIGVTLALNDVQSTSDDIASLDLRVDKSYIWEPQTDPRAFYFWNKRTYGTPCIDGIFYFDFDQYADTDDQLYKMLADDSKIAPSKFQPSLGRLLNTKDAKSIIAGFDIPVGTVLGATPRLHYTTRKLMQVG